MLFINNKLIVDVRDGSRIVVRFKQINALPVFVRASIKVETGLSFLSNQTSSEPQY